MGISVAVGDLNDCGGSHWLWGISVAVGDINDCGGSHWLWGISLAMGESQWLWGILVAVGDLSGCAQVCCQHFRGYVVRPDAVPLFSFSTAFLASSPVDISMLIGRGVSAGDMSGAASDAGRFNSSEMCSVHLLNAGRFNSSEMCSVHLLSCTWTVVRGLPCLSLTILSVCRYLPANVLVMSHICFMFLCIAVPSACFARLSVWPLLSAHMFLFTSL